MARLKTAKEKTMLAMIEAATAEVYAMFPKAEEIIPSFWGGDDLTLDVKVDDENWRRFHWREDY